MPKSTAHAQALARDLADKLSKRIAGSASINTVRAANDANGWPMLFLSVAGNEAAGQPVIGIRISNPASLSPDVFGNASSAYAPHIAEMAYELSATANKALPSLADAALAQYEVCAMGCRFQLKEIANTNAVDEANMNAAAVAADLESLYWPTKSI